MDNENLIPKFELEPEELTERKIRQHKIAGCIVAACMIILGIMMVVIPQGGSFADNYGLSIGVLIMGLYEMIAFFRTAPPYRNDMALASGIIMILMGAVILVLSVGNMASQDMMLGLFTVALGFITIYRGIMQLFSCSRFKRLDEKDTAWLQLSGILNIVLGVLVVILPFTGLLLTSVVLGIYLAVAGVALLTEAVSGKVARKR